MFQNDNLLYKIVLLFCMIFSLPLLALNVRNFTGDLAAIVSGVLFILALIAVFYYILMGYTKNQAWAYKCYMICFTLAILIRLLHICLEIKDPLATLFEAIVFALVLVVLLSKDLGKRNSLIICGLAVASAVGGLIHYLIREPITVVDGTLNLETAFIRTATSLTLALMMLLITYAKYIDKKQRGRA